MNDQSKFDLEVTCRARGLAARLATWKHRSLAGSTFQFAFASAVLALYSRNIVCSALRAFLGI